MILGVGADIVAIARIERLLARFGAAFTERVFTPGEHRACERRAACAACYAKRYAAKEALFKAMGSGLRQGLSWQDAEVVNDGQGAPSLRLSPALHERLHGQHGVPAMALVSLSDETRGAGGYALAFVMLTADSAAHGI